MQLSAEEFHSLLLSVGPLGARRTGEKRLFIRVNADSMVTIIPLGPGQPSPQQVHVIDISRRGVCIQRDQVMDPGCQFILCLSLDGGKKTQTVLTVVHRAQELPRGGHEMGCEFIGSIQSAVPSDHVLKGLKKFQTALFTADLEMV